MKRSTFLRGSSRLALAFALTGGLAAGAAHAQQRPGDAPVEVEEVV